MATLGRRYREGDQSGSGSRGTYFCAHLILICCLAYVLFAQRLLLGVSTGGRGTLQALDLLVPTVAGSLLLWVGRVKGLRLLQHGPNGLYFWPYVLITIALPCIGVLVNSDPIRTVYGSVQGFIALAFLVLGAWGAYTGDVVRRAGRVYAWIAVVGECLFALIDYLHKTGLYRTQVGEFLLRWNVESAGTLGEYTFLTWRCVGTYVNPNELGFWSVLAFWISTLLFKRMWRVSAMIAAVTTLVLSQSRGSMFALFGTFAVWLGYLAMSTDRSQRKARDVAFLLAICFILLAGWTAAVLSQTDKVNISGEFSFIERFERGFTVMTEGASADPNAIGRLNAWRKALDFYYEHPLGTWTSPRLVFHSYIDSDYVRVLLQGSPLYVGAILLVLYGAFRRIAKTGIAPRLTAMLAVGIAINAISAYPFLYPAIGIFWLSMGYDLAQARRVPATSLKRPAMAYPRFTAESIAG